MLLILSQKNDITTFRVIRWLTKYNIPFVNVTDDDELTDLEIRIANNDFHVLLSFEKKAINLSTIDRFWYRRGNLILSKNLTVLGDLANEHLYFEVDACRDYILEYLHGLKIVAGSIYKTNSNKLTFLQKSKQAKILIPETYIINKKNALNKLFEKDKKYITKVISDSVYIKTRIKNVVSIKRSYTSLLNRNLYREKPKTFYLSLVQEHIDKKYEIRVFYFKGLIWSMCIFSQKNPKTSVDFRHYDKVLPNRNVPFHLPKSIEKQVHNIMKAMSIDSGSLDILVTLDDQFVFLEVNPDGQIDFLSQECNYYIEREIAMFYAK